ncbi:MAG: CRTAC1 family protein [Flavobacteriales bacterium]|nr:CRTAC1 family protein [Flavobacteriales bacterium]MCB9166377.1 CRTAC1 family protein [Flavobacteriales bacterium]
MQKPTLVLAACFLSASGFTQTFTLSTSVLSNTSARTGGCVGVADMDGDGYDDLLLLNQSTHLYIDYQNANGTFSSYDYGTVSGSSQWGMAAGDVDNDGHKDVFSGGSYDGVHFKEINARGSSSSVTSLSNGNMFMQCANLADMNNDGWLDAFGCHDDGAPHVWYNNGSGSLVPNSSIDFSTACSGQSGDMSGNYGSVFIDFDNDGDLDFQISHCRQGVNSSSDCRRWDRLFVNDGNNNYSDLAGTYGMENHEQVWTTDFGDLDNDGDLDAISTTHSSTMMVFINDGAGHFTNATSGSGIEYSSFFLQSKLEDLDNDGYLDLITAGGEYYFHGDGDGTFTQIANMLPEPGSGYTLHTFATGDLNHDGFIDVYAGYGSSYVTPSSSKNDQLYLNNGNSNHFLNFNLEGVESNRDGVGARVTLYGPWGTQIREVRAGESYGIICSFTCHFGLGSALEADSAIVRWPSGTVDRFYNIAADQWIDVREGGTTKAVLDLKVMLEGPYQTGSGLMNDGLRSNNLVPITQPYGGFGLSVVGDAVMAKLAPSVLLVTGNDAIVDWVWVELRDKNNAANILRARPALVQRDGDVVELDGITHLPMGLEDDQYHVVVRHRNHLGCMTAGAIALSGSPTAIDLTDPGTTTYGTDARKNVNGTMVLYAGNTVWDGLLKYAGASNDRDPVLLAIGGTVPTSTTTGYLSTDVTMDGTIKYAGANNDRDPILVNIGGSVPTATRAQQLP